MLVKLGLFGAFGAFVFTIWMYLNTSKQQNVLPVVNRYTVSKSQDDDGSNFKAVDYSSTDLPKVEINGRIIDIINGIHFDDLMQDTPSEFRPPSVIAFFDSSDAQCMGRFNKISFKRMAEEHLPARERLLIGKYDMYSAPKRAWFKFTPEMDLKERFHVTSCPQIVFVPPTCDGYTEWCVEPTRPEDPSVQHVGCKDFVDSCKDTVLYDGELKFSPIFDWITEKVQETGTPKLVPFLGSYHTQGLWMRDRDLVTVDNIMRNIYLSKSFPAFTERGFKPMQIPSEMYKELMDFYHKHESKRVTESWSAESTQISFHEHPTGIVNLDIDYSMKVRLANKYLKPLLEEWSGIKPLKLTSFYGLREYPEGISLKNHVDRVDTHVLSVTLSLLKFNFTENAQSWPLEVIDWNGEHVRYEHPAGSMVLYESAKLPHGRPFRNQEGIHLGCFCHFIPDQLNSTEAKAWKDYADRAHKLSKDNSIRLQYVTVPSKEEANPIYTKVNYGEKTNWARRPATRNTEIDEGLDVLFQNTHDRPLQLYWIDDHSAPQLQQTLAPGDVARMKSYHNHRFHWADSEENALKPLSVSIVNRQGVYTPKL